ncbi:MAG: ion transporter [Candidatus Competibacteraceae bacterium]|nr:ion transporter [Candidatus Competibacteraceae bacterium]
MSSSLHERPLSSWRAKLHEIIFEADTPAGKAFDVGLIVCIVLSTLCVMLDSMRELRTAYGATLNRLEWGFTLLFTAEYLVRLVAVRRPLKYATSFYGIVDLLSIVPTYLSLWAANTHYLLVIRLLRILRIFRVLKLTTYVGEARLLTQAIQSSRRKIGVFFFAILTLVVILGSIMYVVEGESNGYTSIPRSIYWAIVTLTTVGYGDISPKTDLGQFISSLVMILGYAIIAVPTGIVTVEMANAFRHASNTQACPSCAAEGHDNDAVYCKYCGSRL